jgi:Flp pilus assembly protein TadB
MTHTVNNPEALERATAPEPATAPERATYPERATAVPDRMSAEPERATAELVRTAAEQISRLVRDELRLAQAEIARKGRYAGVGAGLFGAGGLVALYGVAALLTAVVLLLAYVMPAWLAAVIVGVVLLGVAAILALVGKKQVQQATPVVPEESVHSVKEDIETVAEAVKERNHR